MYSDIVRKHAVRPLNHGALSGANAQGTSVFPTCGDNFHLFVRVEDSCIQEATFEAQGCGPVFAMGSIGTNLIKGQTVEQALKLNAFDLDKRLGGLPPAKRHAILLFLDALHEALAHLSTSGGQPT